MPPGNGAILYLGSTHIDRFSSTLVTLTDTLPRHPTYVCLFPHDCTGEQFREIKMGERLELDHVNVENETARDEYFQGSGRRTGEFYRAAST